MRIAVGAIAQESQSFSPVAGTWAHFEGALLRGRDLIERFRGTDTECGGVIEIAERDGIELIPLISANAAASAGPMEHGVFESLLNELLERLANAGPVDGVLAVLHGALLTTELDDGTGQVLAQIRAAVGATVPVVGSLDLHANVTEQMVEQADALIGYRTYPHVDMGACAARATELLVSVIRGDRRPVTALRRLPMLPFFVLVAQSTQEISPTLFPTRRRPLTVINSSSGDVLPRLLQLEK